MEENGHLTTAAEARWFKFYLAVVKDGRDVMAEVTKALYKGGILRPDLYLKNSCEYTEEDYTKSFMFLQKEAIEEWPATRPFNIAEAVKNPKWDITLHHQLQQTTCHLEEHSNGIGNLLFRLKGLRNRICHDVPELTQNQLHHKKIELENLCCKILEALGKATNTNYDDLAQDVRAKLMERLSPVTDLQETVTKAYHSAAECLSKAKTELQKHYKNLKIFDTESFNVRESESLSNAYVTPSITLCYAERKSQFWYNKKIQTDNILSVLHSDKTKHKVVVVGTTGSGKSALLLHLLESWCLGTFSMKNIEKADLIFYIEMRSLQTASLSSLIKDYLLKETFVRIGGKQTIKKLRQWKCVWLLDGFDEGRASGRSIAEEICDNFPSVIMTVCPDFVSQLTTSKIKYTAFLELDALNTTFAMELCRKVFIRQCCSEKSNKMVEKFKEFVVGSGGLYQGLITSPYQVSRLCLSWLENHNKYESVEPSVLFSRDLLEISLDQVTEYLLQKTSESKNILKRKMLKVLDCLSKIAWELVNDDDRRLNEKHIAQVTGLCKQLKLYEHHITILSPFLVRLHCCENRTNNHRHNYKYSEIRNVEFFAARHLVSLLKRDRKFALYKVLENDKRWSKVMVNFVGIVAVENAFNPTLAKQVVDYVRGIEYETADWMHLLYESMGNSSLAEEMSAILDSSHFQLVTLDKLLNRWKAISSLVHHWRMRVVRLKLDEKPDQLDVVAARIVILSHYVTEISVLCDWSLYKLHCTEVDDDLLCCLTGNLCCHLTEFAGHLSPDAIMKLLPGTVKFLSLRLRNHEQALALQHWLLRHPVAEVKLILDFPRNLQPSLLPRLTPRWVFPSDDIESFATRSIKILRSDFVRINWENETVTNLCGNIYHLAPFDTSNEHSEKCPTSQFFQGIGVHNDLTFKRRRRVSAKVKLNHPQMVCSQSQTKYLSTWSTYFQRCRKIRCHKRRVSSKIRARIHSSESTNLGEEIREIGSLDENIFLVLKLMLVSALWNTLVVHNEGLHDAGAIGLILTLLLYFFPC